MKVLACIPARLASTRFPNKVLAKDTGKFLIQHTYERICQAKSINRAIIAVDDEKVADAVKSFGAEYVMTSPEHKSGTDRIAVEGRPAPVPFDAGVVLLRRPGGDRHTGCGGRPGHPGRHVDV